MANYTANARTTEKPLSPKSSTVNPAPADQGKRREFYLQTIQTRWSAMTPRQRRRFTRRYPTIGIAIRHLVDDGLIRPQSQA